jgi:hypothetical protein
MTPARAAWIKAVVTWGIVALLLWSATAGQPVGDDSWVQQLLVAAGLLGTPLAAAGAVIAHRLVTVARGPDTSERLVRLATPDSVAPATSGVSRCAPSSRASTNRASAADSRSDAP